MTNVIKAVWNRLTLEDQLDVVLIGWCVVLIGIIELYVYSGFTI